MKYGYVLGPLKGGGGEGRGGGEEGGEKENEVQSGGGHTIR